MITENQKVIVVDDDFDEVKPLLTALWKKGFSCLYLDGTPENLPEKFCKGIRLLFLDIEIGTIGASSKTKGATVANIVKHIIGENTFPYFIVFWTKHSIDIKSVLGYLKDQHIAPVGYLDFEKPQEINAEIIVQDILEKLNTQFNDKPIFECLLQWENCIENSIYNFSDHFFSSVPTEGEYDIWHKKTAKLFGKLALSYSGEKALVNNGAEDIKNAFLMLADSFRDTIQNFIKEENLQGILLTDEKLDIADIAKLNTSLFLDLHPNKKPLLGHIFSHDSNDDNLTKALHKSILNDKPVPQNTKVVGMVITPSCDLANKKNLYDNSEQKYCYRILYGLLIPILGKEIEDLNEWFKQLKKNKNEAKFELSPFFFNEKQYILIFHLNSIHSLWWKENEIPEFMFSLREQLAFDIQSKAASHSNRLGNNMILFEH